MIRDASCSDSSKTNIYTIDPQYGGVTLNHGPHCIESLTTKNNLDDPVSFSPLLEITFKLTVVLVGVR